MMDSSENDRPRRPVTRPFVSGRPVARIELGTSAYTPPRPFSFAGARTNTGSAMTTTATTVATAGSAPTPRWTVAVYTPGLEHVTSAADEASDFLGVRPTSDMVDASLAEASLAFAEDVIEAGRHSSSMAAAEVLEIVAHRLRRGEILLLPGANTQTEAAVVSSVLAALLGGRR